LACDADRDKRRPFDGIWQLEPSDNGGKANTFLLANGDLMMAIEYVPDPNTSIYRYFGNGISTEITTSNDTIKTKMMKATIVMEGKDRAVMRIDGNDETARLNRIPMPPYIQRMLATTKTIAR